MVVTRGALYRIGAAAVAPTVAADRFTDVRAVL
jgi:hypothetical protein